MAVGYLSIVLHAHLPYVRHPEDATVMEEQWLYEAITGTYLPLVQMFEGMLADGVRARATVSLSAPLINMLTDDLLKERYAARLDQLIELAEKEIDRTKNEPHYQRNAHMYHDRFQSLRYTWRCHEGNLVRAFRRLQDAGVIEVITSTATHAYFPNMDRNWAAMRAQVHTAADLYERQFGRRTGGMWLGECGYVPGVDELLREAGIRYFFVDTHGILFADRRPIYGVYAPLYCPSGVAAFGRDTESSRQVWSAKEGYPGDPHYRDFYRDIGFDLPMDYIGPYVHPEGHRMATGLKYHAITHNQLHDKWVYDRDIARRRAGEHAMHFRTNREYLDRHATNQLSVPCASSWGHAGYNEYWLNESNAWIYRHLHVAAERMVELSHRFPRAEGIAHRALKQAARELLLAESSDWAFIMRTGTTVPYAERRTNAHILQFNRLYEDLVRGEVSERWLSEIEAKDNIFPDVDYRLYAS